MAKQTFFFTAFFVMSALQATSGFAQGSLIGDVEERWTRVSYCRIQVFDAPELQYAIYQNDHARVKATEAFIRQFAVEKFGKSDAAKLESKAFFAGSFMEWGKERKLVKALPLKEKLEVLKWCRTVFMKEQ
jgi:hypothetical protein